MIITSKDNALVKHINKLKEKKYRYSFNEYVIEGERLVFDALKYNQNFKHILIQQGKTQNYCSLLDNVDCEITLINEEIAKFISSTVSNQGIFAVLEMPNINYTVTNKVLILDNIQDPGNLGTLLRSAAATDFKTVFLYNCVDAYNDKVLRSTMGGIFRVNVLKVDLEDIKQLKNNKYSIFKADMDGENVFNIDIKQENIALVVGNEANGVSKEVSSICTSSLSIPMKNNVESLNAGVSGSILMYELSKGEF